MTTSLYHPSAFLRWLPPAGLLLLGILLGGPLPLTSAADSPSEGRTSYPDIPEPVTSFGAAIVGDALYLYGGHTGSAHSYSAEAQGKTLWRLNLNEPQGWEKVASDVGLQGLAMVAHGDRLYRIGGFTAKNDDGEEHDLWSQDTVVAYDLKAEQWQKLPSLPEPRSSFDAAVLDHTIYVVGGWQIRGDEHLWHDTAYALDLSAESPEWKALAPPPFERRALSVAAYQGKLYAIGGMTKEGKPTTRVDVYDVASGTWSQGPDLQGEGMDGFGSSAFAVGGRLYTSTLHGTLQRLAEDGKSWEIVRELEPARFFHRMLPLGDDRLVFIGGANMSEGKYEEIGIVQVK
ncbi:Kelch repeat-containing protein [Candidatus Laterigemmans baculatus]|uniref:Kelch repeat-containing protein n=1 Tax=Candidatus Laterigemmans baculatus TaxID=2770505 RepID=UPI001F1D0A82|nr:kelch repeat-containing protein [Candidatus Laterigemmans baculatus]